MAHALVMWEQCQLALGLFSAGLCSEIPNNNIVISNMFCPVFEGSVTSKGVCSGGTVNKVMGNSN